MFIDEIKWQLFPCKDRVCIQAMATINGVNWNFPEHLDENGNSIKLAQLKIMKAIISRANKADT